MEFAPASAPSTGVGKRGYNSPRPTDGDSNNPASEGQQQATGASRPGSAPPSLNFEASNLFRFDSSSDFFAPMKYGDDELTSTGASPTGTTDNNSVSNADSRPGSDGGNNDVLPPHALSPSNQAGHEDDDDGDGVVADAGRHYAKDAEANAVGASSEGSTGSKPRKPLEMLPSRGASSRRKNSIEMFLSQSPSQALGGDFLKLSLDDRQMSLQANSRANGGARAAGSGAASSTSTADSYASGQFQLNPVQESPQEYASMGGRYRQTPPTSQQQEHYRAGGRETQTQQQLPPPLSISRANSMPGNANAGANGYNGSYVMSPQMASEDSWSGSQGGSQHDGSALYAEQMQGYYGNSQMAAPYVREQQQYRSPQPVPAPYGYGGTPSRAQMASAAQWNPMMVAPPPAGMYDPATGGMYMNPRSSPMRHGHNQMGGYPGPQSQQLGMGMRSGRGGNRGMYSRMTPPLPDASPPHSPRKLGSNKQCKFFLQGHCRMGNKCKFVHQTGSTSEHGGQHQHLGGGSYGSSRANSGMMYQQSRMLMSPPSHLMPQRHQMGGEELGHGYGGRQQGRLYRSNGGDVGSSNLGFMSGGLSQSASSPLLGGGGDSASLSTALSVEDIQNRVFAMSKDQNGCRLLQEQLDYEDRADLCAVIYQESLEHLAEMMVDPFGNYLFQKLLERVDEKQRLVIIRRVSSNLVAAALNLHGTRSVQKVVEVCATSPDVVEEDFEDEDEDEIVDGSEDRLRAGTTMTEGGRRQRTTSLPDLIVEALKDDAVRLCIDSNGNHVIQRALQFMKPEYNQFVFDAVCKECTTVGTHRHGCCVLQRCLDAANKAQKIEVITQVERQAMKLMQDPYGNYVVQYVLDSCTAEEAYGVIMKPLGHIFELSVQKFSSNVIEKCLEKAPERVRQKYIAEITSCPKMNKMLQDQFANYVVQRALCVCAEEQCLLLVQAIRPHLAAMKNTSGGRRITARILKRFPAMDISVDIGLSPTADTMFDGGNGGGSHLMLSRLPPPAGMNAGGSYGHHHQHHQPPSHMYGAMHGGGAHLGAASHLQGGGSSRLAQSRGGNDDGSVLLMNDVGGMGMNAASRA